MVNGEDLDGDGFAIAGAGGEVDLAHAALAEEGFDFDAWEVEFAVFDLCKALAE